MDKKLMLDWLQNQKPQITGINMLSRNLNEIAINKVPTKTSGLPNQSLINAAAEITKKARAKEEAIAAERARRKQELQEVTHAYSGGKGVFVTAPLTGSPSQQLNTTGKRLAAQVAAARLRKDPADFRAGMMATKLGLGVRNPQGAVMTVSPSLTDTKRSEIFRGGKLTTGGLDEPHLLQQTTLDPVRPNQEMSTFKTMPKTSPDTENLRIAAGREFRRTSLQALARRRRAAASARDPEQTFEE